MTFNNNKNLVFSTYLLIFVLIILAASIIIIILTNLSKITTILILISAFLVFLMPIIFLKFFKIEVAEGGITIYNYNVYKFYISEFNRPRIEIDYRFVKNIELDSNFLFPSLTIHLLFENRIRKLYFFLFFFSKKDLKKMEIEIYKKIYLG